MAETLSMFVDKVQDVRETGTALVMYRWLNLDSEDLVVQ